MIKKYNLELTYPNLGNYNYRIIKFGNPLYNCLGLANGDRTRWWDYAPGYNSLGGSAYWPLDIPRNWRVETIALLFENRGYEICKSAEYEENFQKVAIYMNVNCKASHIAIMNKPAMWTSKLGKTEEIEHDSLQALTGIYPAYGWIATTLKRPLNYSEKN